MRATSCPEGSHGGLPATGRTRLRWTHRAARKRSRPSRTSWSSNDECRESRAGLGPYRPERTAATRHPRRSTRRARERWDTEGSYDHESQAQAVLLRARLRHRRLRPRRGRVLRRLADADRAGQAAAAPAAPAAAGRADQPPRPRGAQLAGGLPAPPIRFTVILVAHDRYFLDVDGARASPRYRAAS